MSSVPKRVGYYCWAGPGTVRMIRLKYFNAPIDEVSVMGSYDLDVLKEVKTKFGVTDAWVSYSWGFADETEKDDKEFTLSKLDNFRRLGIRTHAYLQGPNLVYQDFLGKEWWARDQKGKLVSYHRRKVVCLNNREFRLYIDQKVKEMCQQDFDGIFMDNIQMGQLGLPDCVSNKRAFFGCNCDVCNQQFFHHHGVSIKEAWQTVAGRETYRQFRLNSTISFLRDVSTVVRNAGKEFGSNSFDPKFDMSVVFGTDLNKLNSIQDYILFENHSFPQGKRKNNAYISTLIDESGVTKPVFVVSYKKGIGFDSHFSQKDIDNVFTEANWSRFNLCLKGSEFVTKNKWHNLDISRYRSPQQSRLNVGMNRGSHFTNMRRLLRIKVLYSIIPFSLLTVFFEYYLEKKVVRKSMAWLQIMLLK